MNLHALLAEISAHTHEVPRNLYWEAECHADVWTAATEESISDAQLPHDRSQPLLTRAEIGRL